MPEQLAIGNKLPIAGLVQISLNVCFSQSYRQIYALKGSLSSLV